MPESQLPEPRIIPHSEHPISRKNIDREALKVMYRLRDAGYLAYLVGGGVRDLFLGKKPKDFDISTDARPGELRKLFRNSRIIGRRFRLVQVFFHGGKIIEVSTFRCRGEYDLNGDEVLPSNNTFGTPAEDAFRRDLTINALFYEIENFTVIDYTGGVEDLKRGVVRMVGDPERRIIRDPVRMMRAVRHAARNDFTIEEATWRAIREHAPKLALCPTSRIRDEFFKDLRGGASRRWAKLALASGILHQIVPLYRNILPALDESALLRESFADLSPRLDLLFRLLDVLDRLVDRGDEPAEELLLALFLLPWADQRFGLLDLKLKRQEFYPFSRKLRSALDEGLEGLNIRRSVKEAMATLLASLPVFLEHAKDSSWPKWLVRKSYFPLGSIFFALYQAALGESELPALGKRVGDAPRKRPRRKKGGRRRGAKGRVPAFARKKGGIFGLNK